MCVCGEEAEREARRVIGDVRRSFALWLSLLFALLFVVLLVRCVCVPCARVNRMYRARKIEQNEKENTIFFLNYEFVYKTTRRETKMKEEKRATTKTKEKKKHRMTALNVWA